MASPVISREQYRREQEAFVSNHGGTSPREIIIVLLPNVCGVLLAATTVAVLEKYVHRNVRAVVEFALTVIPSILCCTILSERVGDVCVAMLLVSVLNILLLLLSNKGTNPPDSVVQPVVDKKRPFLTNFRALTNIVTAICILAVDFRIFPRKFAKTEVFGYSLMDTGVGFFVLTNALVAPEARDFSGQLRSQSLTKNMKNCFRSCAPLFVLGVGRFVVVECTSYQKHVSEYGVHWNFFITLAVIKLFTSMITSTISSKYSLLSGIWILGMHEYAMSAKHLKAWVLSDVPRDDFFSANREGLISVPGYIGLYFIGVGIGRAIHSTYHNSHAKYSTPQRCREGVLAKLYSFVSNARNNVSLLLFVKLSLISAQAGVATSFCDSYFKISRRLANAGYCMWVLTLTTALLTLLLLVEVVLDVINFAIGEPHAGGNNVGKLRQNLRLNLKKSVESREADKRDVIKRSLDIFEAANYNGLFFFLLSNVMTGLVNMLVYTLYTKQEIALSILIVYMAISIFSTLLLYRLQISIKL